MIRYVERNPVRAKLALGAADWKYSSFHERRKKNNFLSDTIIELPDNYTKWVNEGDENVDRIRASVNRGLPLGSDKWSLDVKDRFNLKFDALMGVVR